MTGIRYCVAISVANFLNSSVMSPLRSLSGGMVMGTVFSR